MWITWIAYVPLRPDVCIQTYCAGGLGQFCQKRLCWNVGQFSIASSRTLARIRVVALNFPLVKMCTRNPLLTSRTQLRLNLRLLCANTPVTEFLWVQWKRLLLTRRHPIEPLNVCAETCWTLTCRAMPAAPAVDIPPLRSVSRTVALR